MLQGSCAVSSHAHTVLRGITHRGRYFCGSEALPTRGLDPITPPSTSDTRSARPLQGKVRHGGEERIFQGHAQGLSQGRIGEREMNHSEPRGAERSREGSPGQGLGCYDGAEPWEGGIPSNPSHPNLPHPPGNLNPGFSRAASTGVTGYKKQLRSPVPQTTATEIIMTIMSLKSRQLSQVWEAGCTGRGAPGEGGPPSLRAELTQGARTRPRFSGCPPRASGFVLGCAGSPRPEQGRARCLPDSLPSFPPHRRHRDPRHPGGSPDFGGYL